MRSQSEIILWLLKKLGESIKDHAEYYTEDLGETADGIWDWIKQTSVSMITMVKDGIKYMIDNPRETLATLWKLVKPSKWTIAGIVVYVIPLLVGFTPGGIAAGSLAAAWQSSIGIVARGSVFALIQSWAATGVFAGISTVLYRLGSLSTLLKLLPSLHIPGAPFPVFTREFVHRLTRGVDAGRGSPSQQTQVSRPVDDELAFAPDTGDPTFWKWLAGGPKPPFSPGITSKDLRILVLSLLVGDEELPLLVRDADITEEERNNIWEAVAALHTESLGDAYPLS